MSDETDTAITELTKAVNRVADVLEKSHPQRFAASRPVSIRCRMEGCRGNVGPYSQCNLSQGHDGSHDFRPSQEDKSA